MPTSLELFIEMDRLALAGQTVMVVNDHIDQKYDESLNNPTLTWLRQNRLVGREGLEVLSPGYSKRQNVMSLSSGQAKRSWTAL